MTNENKFRDLVKKMAVDLRQARSRADALVERDHEPIAVVGIGCRFPGGVDSPEGLWELVSDERDTLGAFPTDRGWDLDGLFDPDPDASGRSYADRAGFLDDAGGFDPGFFGISPREALAMDPQQRLILQTSWEAVERAGIDPAALHSTSAGVFMGVVGQPYGPPVQQATDGLDGYLMVGSMPAVAAGRVSYTLGLQGPAVSVDTACSSSLVALHSAIRSLRSGESSLALAGGATVYCATDSWVSFSRQRALSADGRCKAFSADADGTGWGEAAGVLVLERLSDARREGRRILAVLRGSAINQDGASSGLTAPNGPAQERVIRSALADARLAPEEVDAVEAHGTGTKLGDPIEANALLAAYGRGRPADRPLWLGSLKSNIGHTGAAAGVSGVIKAIMAIRAGRLPRTLHVTEPTPFVDWDSGAVELLTEARDWPDTGRPRRVGVSAFGVSGTNAHVIVEQADEPAEPRREAGHDGAVLPWVLSARTPEALTAQAARLHAHAAARPEADPADVGWSLATTRSHFHHRAAVVGADRGALMDGLRALAEDTGGPGVVTGSPDGQGRTVFVFPGQGTQWPAMARDLMAESEVFAERVDACERALAPYNDWSLTAALRQEAGAPPADRVDVVPQVLWAVMIGLAALWRSHGVHPDAVVGHSQGEVAAAYVAGALTLEDSAKVIALRSRAMADLSGSGAMASVALDADTVRRAVSEYGGRVDVAVVNGPEATVVGGEARAVDDLVARFREQGVQARVVVPDLASHTGRVEPVREGLIADLAGIAPRQADIPVYSPVTGQALGDRLQDAEYWYSGLRETVRFHEVTQALLDAGYGMFIEVSPHPVLTVPIQETAAAAGADPAVLPSLRRDEGGLARFRTSLAEAHTRGADVDWRAVFGDGARTVDLPTYPFQNRHYWLQGAGRCADATSAGLEGEDHPLLGAALPLAETGGVVFTGRISRATHPWLADHAALDTVLLPGTAFLELAWNAGERTGSPHVAELVVQAPLEVPEGGAVQLQVAVSAPDDDGRRALTVHSRAAGSADDPDLGRRPWTRNATGTLAPEPVTEPTPLTEWPPPGGAPLPVEGIYDRLALTGYVYGPAFQGLRAAWRVGDEVFAEVDLPEQGHADAARFGLHPALSDAAQHAIGLLPGAGDRLRLPFSWTDVSLHAVAATRLRVRVTPTGDDTVAMELSDATGTPVASVGQLALRATDRDRLLAGTRTEPDDLFRVAWSPTVPAPSRPGTWAVLGGDVLDTASALTASGHTVRVYADHTALHAALDEGAPVPEQILMPSYAAVPGFARPETIHGELTDLITTAQALLADERTEAARQVLLTSRAVAVEEGAPTELVRAPLWGFVRSAALEHPGRFAIVDTDDPGRTGAPLIAALTGGGEQVAVRDGVVYEPGLVRVPRPDAPAPGFGGGTVLLTGATGTLGGELARYLVDRHGVRELLLVSRSGPDAKGAAELKADLVARGASVTLTACDAADRDELARVIDSVPAHAPLTAVVHVAVALDDGVLTGLTAGQVDRVLASKVDAAWHLHDLTADHDLAAFVMFSSAAGTFGGSGQSHYGAANAFLDALAHHRRALGLPAVSMSWGLWEQRSDSTAGLGAADIHRYARLGMAGPVGTEHGLSLFDTALASGRPHLVPVPLDLAGARSRAARTGRVPLLLRGLVRPPRRRASSGAADGAGTRELLSRVPFEQREQTLVDLVRERTAEVLGHSGTGAVGADQPFLEMGFDSLTAVELRNHLGAATRLRLPAGLVFTHTTPTAVARFLNGELGPDTATAEGDVRGGNGSAGSAAPVEEGLVELFTESCARGRIAEGLEMLGHAARIRPTFTGPDDIGRPPVPVHLAQGRGDRPMLVCLPSILMISGAQEYARFAAGVRGFRDVVVVPQPGFVDGEPLPATVGAVSQVLAETVTRIVDGRPFVLVGRSSGSWVAHAAAERLEGMGAVPGALALLDPPYPTDESALPTIETGVVERGELLGIMDAVRMTAMGSYLRLFRSWLPSPLSAPTVVLRPETATVDRHGDAVPAFTWEPVHDVLRVPGDHFSMLEGHVDVVGRALHDWLAERDL